MDASKTLPDCGRCNTWEVEDASAHADETGHFPMRCEPTARFPEDTVNLPPDEFAAALDKFRDETTRAVEELRVAIRRFLLLPDEEPEPEPCSFVVFTGSPNPDSPRFGPDEFCEGDAIDGTGYCAAHLPWAEAQL